MVLSKKQYVLIYSFKMTSSAAILRMEYRLARIEAGKSCINN